MTGILVMSHGDLAEGMLNTLQCLYGEAEQIEALTLMPEDSEEVFNVRMNEAIARLDTGDGVLLMVDILGGSPCKAIGYRMAKDGNARVEVITGANLPMLIVAAETREYAKLDEVKAQSLEAGVGGVRDLRKLLKLD